MKKLRSLTCAAATVALMTSCGYGSDVILDNPGDNTDETQKPASEYFDFTTSNTVYLDINFGSMCAYTLVDIFDEYPEQLSEEGDPTMIAEPIFRVFADANGRINESVELPAHAEHVYLHANQMGMPDYIELDVKNGRLSYDYLQESEATKAGTRSTRADETEKTYQLWTVDEANKVYALNPWEGSRYGKMTDVNGLLSEDKISENMLTRLRKALWKGATTRPSGTDNRKWAEGVDERALTTTLAKTGIENGEEVTYKDAEVWVTMVDEYAYSQISLGYYYYPSDEKQSPESFKNLKKYIIFPNTSIPDKVPYVKKGAYNGGMYNYYRENAPVKLGSKCQLLYEDENGNISTHFPAGYTIGYFIISKLVTDGRDILPDPTYKIPSILSDTRRCAESYMNKDGKFSCIALLADGEQTIFCFENKVPGVGSDSYTYDDVIFTVMTTPSKIDKQFKPMELPTYETEVETFQKTIRTYTYEDQWPNAGDYDLNDVMVEHEQVVYFNQKNVVTKIVDTFIPIQPAGSATYNNAFCYKADYMGGATVTTSNGIVKEEETGAYILFASANNSRGKSFVITTVPPSGSLNKDSEKFRTYDPFVIVRYTAGQINRKEIHLPKHKCTSMADESEVGTKSDAYYVDKDGKHPFALEVPIPVDPRRVGFNKVFTPVTEIVSIDKEYPKFNVWVDSFGKSYADWYLHYVKKD